MTSFANVVELHDDRNPWGPRAVPSQLDYEPHDTHGCDSWAKDLSLPFESVLQKALKDCPMIASDADVIFGTPRIAGTRIPVYMVLDAVRYYGTVSGVLASYPQLTTEQVSEALNFAALVLEQPVDDETTPSIG